MRIVLDWQHVGKYNRPQDRGAVYVHNGESYKEAYLVGEYINKVFRYISENTLHDIFIISSDLYWKRHKQINVNNIDLVLACHLNSCAVGVGTYSLVEYLVSQSDNENTKKAAEIFSNSFKKDLPVSKSIVKIIGNNNRGSYCIRNSLPTSLILEPLFLNNDEHLDFILNYSYKIAGSISKSIIEYGEYLKSEETKKEEII